MNTLRLIVNPAQLTDPAAEEAIDQAARILRSGGLVALPTETVYGLGAHALDATAVERIFIAKRRPAWDPVIVHIAPLDTKLHMLDGLVEEIPERALKLMQAFWPGPLTLLLPRTHAVPDAVTAGRPLVGIRMPSHPVALAVIRRTQIPVAAPSANLFSHISPTTAAHVLEDLDGRIDAVLDAGPTEHGLESTVLDPCQSPMVIYRPGAVTAEQIRDTAGEVDFFRGAAEIAANSPEALPSPGVGLRHYAPRARLVLVEAPAAALAERLRESVLQWRGERVGVMLPAGIATPAAAVTYAWGNWGNPQEMARELYAGLRNLDAAGCTVIVCPMPPAGGIGDALRDRLQKAGSEGAREQGSKRMRGGVKGK